MTGYVFYDTETTGILTAFDQILQFGAIRTDEEFNEFDRLDIRCRLMPHVVPAPKALEVTGVTPEMLTDPALPSHYEAMRKIHATLTEWSPAVFIGFNSISFDEPLLRQAFYQTLQPIYLTNTGGNARADIIRIVHAASVYAPNTLSVPIGDNGRQVFKLDQLSPANGFDHSAAHEAMADVEATIHMAKLIKTRAPVVWDAMMKRTRKQEVSELLLDEQILCLTAFYGARPFSWRVTLCGVNPDYDAEHAVFDLENDPADYFQLGVDDLTDVLKKRNKVIRVVRANAQPILMPIDLAPTDLIDSDLPQTELERRATLIHENREFQVRVGQAMAQRYPEEEPSPLIERQIYDGFAGSSDREIMAQFHETGWVERLELAEQLRDKRMKQLAYRLIYLEEPDVLPESTRISFEHRVSERLLSDDPNVPWRTIPKAIQEAEDLLSSNAEYDQQEFYKTVKQFLENRTGGNAA